ncbi:MAG: DUF2723 domain-containing protein [Chloroherpetonaceae bacterium]|nr:DUF2723 domain-containing protein [Chloroherpetonaceae bacterium]
MTHKRLNALVGLFVFLVSEIIYLLTMAPTFSFWDCGEFTAVAYTMGIPHPPGTPIFTMVGRIFTLIPFGDIGARVNLVSTLCSSIAAMFCSLITIQFIELYRVRKADEWSLSEKISAYSAGIISGFALAFSDSFWFNAVESEVYGFSMILNTAVVWLILKWNEVADESGNEKWLILIAYTFGLAIGVHLQSILAFFSLAIIYYNRRYTFSLQSFIVLMVVSSGIFLLMYPGVVKGIPALMRDTTPWVGVLILLGLVYAIYYTHVNKMRMWNTAAIGMFFIVIAYTSFTTVYIRSNHKTPINENSPNTMEKLYSYLNREQYGDLPLLNRRWSQDPDHQQNYEKYTSDWDFFVKYQIGHMWGRYFLWNFAGRAGDVQDDGADFKKLFGIPLIIGLFGMIFHFRKQWNMALAITALFLLTGVFISIYTNPAEPQPRERDYVFVGSFFAFAIWIGIGIDALFETIRESIEDETKLKFGAIGIAAFGLLFINARMLQVNYHMHDRSGNYVPYDYAYNLLNSCEPNGVLFTNGDNDTFPLWYMQEVAGVRQDVRVVNLSLANTDWYILQLKNESPREAQPVKFSLSDAAIKRLNYEEWPAREVVMPVPEGIKEQYQMRDRLRLTEGGLQPETIVDTIRWRFNPTLDAGGGRGFIRAQDRVVYETIYNNLWERPVYFAITVSESNRIGIDKYLRMDGFAYKVVPIASDEGGYGKIDRQIMYHKLMYEFKYRNLNNPSVYLDENSRRLVSNYKNVFLRLAADLIEHENESTSVKDSTGQLNTISNKALALNVLDKAEEILPTELYDMDFRLMQSMISMYIRSGGMDRAKAMLPKLEDKVQKQSDENPADVLPNYYLAQTYRQIGDYKNAYRLFESVRKLYPQDPQLKKESDEVAALAGIAVDSAK